MGTELYPEPKKLGQQLKYADRRGFQVALIAGDQEFDRGVIQMKDLRTGNSSEVSLQDDVALIEAIKSLLSTA